MKYRNYNAKRALPLVAFAAMVFTTSCGNDSLADGDSQASASGKGQTVELTASLNEDKASFYWHTGEAIFVQTKSENSYPGVKFTTSTATEAATVTFTGTIASGTLGTYAVYPYSEKHTFTSATALTYNLPATYTYNKVESNVFSKTESGTTYPENTTNIPLVGKIDNGNIAFKRIGGLAVIRIDKMPATSGTLTVTADQQLSGNFTIADLTATEPVITTTASSGNNTVTFTFSNATQDAAGVFYLPLAMGSYSGVKIEVSSTDKTTASSTVNYGTLDVARASVTAISLDNNNGTTGKYSKDEDGKYIINDHKFVDLGLPSGLLWAETNIGADKATDYGNYYAWGEVNTKGSYSSSNYTYTDNPATLDAAHDAATVNWGSSCRMPTTDEFEELCNSDNCDWEWDSDKRGYKVTSKKSGYTNNSIFLPSSGYRYNGKLENLVNGYYWSSSLYPGHPFYAYCYRFDYHRTHENRYLGYTIRPVAEP